MINDKQYRRLKQLLSKGKNLNEAALKSRMDEKTARKYREQGTFPSELKMEHTWRTRKDPFSDVWEGIEKRLGLEPRLQALTIFQDLQDRYPGKFQDGQLRTLQRKIKKWRAMDGPPKEVMFPQEHYHGRLCQSDFTHMTDLNITIQHQPFPHLVYHFVFTKSNWETGTICFSETFESLSEGLQCALWRAGGVAEYHQTDCLSAAVNKLDNPEEFTRRYTALMQHYGMNPKRINPGNANENGDVEQSHYRFKQAVDQQLMLRGSRDFSTRKEYERFIMDLFDRRNKGRNKTFTIEQQALKPLPPAKLDSYKSLTCRVSRLATISVDKNIYSIDSRLIGERVKVKVYVEQLEVRYAGAIVATLPRLKGSKNHEINYRHVIDSLIRKPGAFENYKYKSDMFPTTRFKIIYDELLQRKKARCAAKEYLAILNLAAKESESLVDEVIRVLLQEKTDLIDSQAVNDQYVRLKEAVQSEKPDVSIEPVALDQYDALLHSREAACSMMN